MVQVYYFYFSYSLPFEGALEELFTGSLTYSFVTAYIEEEKVGLIHRIHNPCPQGSHRTTDNNRCEDREDVVTIIGNIPK